LPRQTSRTGFLAAAAALAFAPSALAAEGPPSDSDLASTRLLVAVELLLADFYARALKAQRFGAPGNDAVKRALFNENEHLAAVSGILTGAGQAPAEAGDIDFSYPAKTFTSRGNIAQVAVELERIALGAYLGAVAAVQAPSLRLPFAQIAACEAQHVSVFAAEATGHGLGGSFGQPLMIDEASNALGRYTA
jgi:hypothetical protein